jgi:RNA polymerase sigma-70 factor (ECF subfamily)
MNGDDVQREQIVGVQSWCLAVSESDERAVREAALLQAAQTGDLTALDELLALYERPLLVFCFGILGQREDAEDAAQDTMIRALRALPTLRQGQASFRNWIFKIARNVCLDRKGKRQPTEWLDEDRLAIGRELNSPEELALRRLQIADALERLPPPRRAVFLLRVLEGWSAEEIATAVGWNQKRVYNELGKARGALIEWRRRSAEDEAKR